MGTSRRMKQINCGDRRGATPTAISLQELLYVAGVLVLLAKVACERQFFDSNSMKTNLKPRTKFSPACPPGWWSMAGSSWKRRASLVSKTPSLRREGAGAAPSEIHSWPWACWAPRIQS
jgi:hypothetical protein